VTVAGSSRSERLAPLSGLWSNVRRGAGSFSYGFACQACTAAANFGLVVLAAHVIGPAGLGVVAVGFAAYLVILGLARGLVANPLTAQTAAGSPTERAETARFALSLTAAATVAIGCLVAGIGAALPGEIGRSLLLFAPWLIPALVHDLGRSILFRDGRGRAGLIGDGAWLIVMGAMTPIAFATDTDWAVTACWGAGALAGASVILWRLRWTPSSLRRAYGWWKTDAWPFGRWMVMAGALYSAASYASVVALSGVLGSRQFGGLRAVQSVYSPLTLIGPAIAMPGLPLISRVTASSRRRALAITWQLAALTTLATGVYLGVVSALPNLLSFVFGDEFGTFNSIMLPIGVAQLFTAPVSALTVLLIAEQRGHLLVWVGTLNALLLMGCSVGFAYVFGLTGAAWGLAAGSAFGLVVMTLCIRRTRSTPDTNDGSNRAKGDR
jgi:O-antigen/teichoic acid export membrane protein